MKVQASALPPTHLPGIALPADEADLRRYDNDDWRLLALPDGSLLASGPTAHRYTPQGGSVQRRRQRIERRARPENRSGRSGLEPVHRRGRRAPAAGLAAWRQAGSLRARPGMQTWRVSNWTIRAGGVALRLDDQLYTLTPQGRWSQHTWDAKPRSASDAVEHALPWSHSAAIHFGDGLFWAADRDGYGIDPDTARVSRSIKTSTGKLFFGSHAGGCAGARDRCRRRPDIPHHRSGQRPAPLRSGHARRELHVQRGAQRTAACWRSAAANRR